ncbi:hypothetical protein HZA56_17195 [Candidatus Poribacteria bacterium]|nr:hypothetical protein [Candidatus Poribacteria bacterium]
MHIDTIRELFARPPAEYGPTPFWFLNDELDEGRLSSSLEEMKAKGIAGVIIHPRTGMEVEYLSDAFWEKLRFICETLKRLRMQGWIYDEYNWPSGPVGGRLLREHPEFKQSGLDYKLVPASQAAKLLQELPGSLVGAFSLTAKEIVDRTDALTTGAAAVQHGRMLIFFLREVRDLMQVSRSAPWARGERGYLDVLNPAAVDEFMRLTHLEYDRRLKEYYGSPIIGVFTDEIENYSALPYTGCMPDAFRNRFGREFREALPSLAGRLDGIPLETIVRNRTNYFELARDLYAESFFKKISAWASERGLIFTGHLMDDDNIQRLPATNVSFFAPLSRMHMPGIDLLCDKHGFEKEHPALTHANFSPKALSSVAHHCGARRTLCEIWGGNGWASSPEKLKAVLHWAQGCGINFVNPHAAFMSLRGLRKRDYPSSHFPPQPWWRFYGKFSEYIARLSLVNSMGAHTAEILFAFPLKSLWADFDLRAKNSALADFIEAASETLLRNQFDFDYLFDEVLDAGAATIEDGRIKIQGEQFSLLLLPLAAVISAKMLELAEQFVSAGGYLIGLGYEMPAHNEYGEPVSERVGVLFAEKRASNVVCRRLSPDSDADLKWLIKCLAGITKESASRDVVAEGAFARSLICLHRKLEGGDSYFVANLSEEDGQADLAFRCKGRPQVWNPEDGSVKNTLAYKVDEEHTRISARFHPNQAMFFAFTDEPPVDHVDSTNLNLTSVTTEYADGYTSALEVRLMRGARRHTRTVEQAMPPIFLPERWEIDYPVKNIMLLDDWDIDILSDGAPTDWAPRRDSRLGARARIMIEAVRAASAMGQAIKKSLGKLTFPTTKYEPMDVTTDVADRWVAWLGIDSTQLEPYELNELLLNLSRHAGLLIGYDFPPPGSEFAMSATFHAEHIPEDLALVFESSESGPRSVQLNGLKVEGQPGRCFIWDASNVALPVARFIKKGRNRLRLVWRQPSYETLFPSVHGIEPVCLAGTFRVIEGRIVEQKYGVPAMPWAQIGFPNYIGSLTYRSSFDLPMKYIGRQLFLKFDRVCSAAEVRVNGQIAGVILWRPYALDVTTFLKPGENFIEITVANTAANLLARPEPAGLIGRPYVVPYWRHRIRFAE